eukprot:2940884-Alexandrium_andersonii.AAC.1
MEEAVARMSGVAVARMSLEARPPMPPGCRRLRQGSGAHAPHELALRVLGKVCASSVGYARVLRVMREFCRLAAGDAGFARAMRAMHGVWANAA